MIFLTVGLAAAVAALAVVVWRRSTRSLLAERACKKVIVTLKHGGAFGGILFAIDGSCLVLRDAQAFEVAENQPVPVDGEIVVLRADVAYLQVV